MATVSTTVRVLVIRPWTESLVAIRAALNDAGCVSRIVRVDIEPALNAALSRGNFDLILFDSSTKDVSREILEARLREHQRYTPIVDIQSTASLVDAIKDALAQRLN